MHSTLRAALTTTAAIALLAAAFTAGRVTAPNPAPAPDSKTCTEVQALGYDFTNASNNRWADPEETRTKGLVYATAVIQNPGCVDVATRAYAQTILDERSQ
ncbi:hypothetical protein [Streptomyces uncialis]|uniref:hypothetical protein n=1 Tax=Streptomyces uncialis TaxID=1048205 RepID=UPI0033E7E20F